MDVRIVYLITLLVYGCVSQNVELNGSKNHTSDPAKQCLTAKNASGLCVQRQGCDYGTAAIDMTLFATYHYQRPCAMEEVCCPPFAIVQLETSTSPTTIDSEEDF